MNIELDEVKIPLSTNHLGRMMTKSKSYQLDLSKNTPGEVSSFSPDKINED